MEKVKVFQATNNPDGLEQKINKWIGEVSPSITRVVQTQSGRLDQHVTLTIFYENCATDADLPLSDPGPSCRCAACYGNF